MVCFAFNDYYVNNCSATFSPNTKHIKWKNIWPSLKGGIWAIIMPVIIIGGILLGIFTPTEAVVIAVVYGFIVSRFMYKEIKLSDIPIIINKTVITSSSVILLIVNAQLYGWILTFEDIPQNVTIFLLSITDNHKVLILILLGIFIIVGMIMDLGANIVILVPLILPLISKIGMDITHFALITIVVLSIGLTTPTVAVCLFIAVDIANSTVIDVAKALVPFLIILVLILLLLTFYSWPYIVYSEFILLDKYFY